MKLRLLFITSLTWISIAAAEPLRIGYIGSLTGDAAAIGTEIAATLRAAVEETNEQGGIGGRFVELVVEDDGYDIRRALTAYEGMRSRLNSRMLFMSTYGALFALGSRPERDDLVVIDTLDCNDEIVKVSPRHTCVATRTESIGKVFIDAIAAGAPGDVGVIYEEEAWFNFIVGSLRRELGSRLIETTVPVGGSDYRAALLRHKARDVEHLVFLGNDSMGRAMQQARELGIHAEFYSIAGVTSPGFRKLAGLSLEGTFVSNWNAPASQETSALRNLFRRVNGREIALEFVAGPTYDAWRLMVEALRRTTGAAQIRSMLSGIPPFSGVTGIIRMDSDGAVRTITESLYRVVGGELIACATARTCRRPPADSADFSE